MDKKEEARKAYVATLNTLVPELAPWINERLAKGQNAYQTLGEFKLALSNKAPEEVLSLLAQARPVLVAPTDLAIVSDGALLAEVARRLREVQTATKKVNKGPLFSAAIMQQIVPATVATSTVATLPAPDLADSAP